MIELLEFIADLLRIMGVVLFTLTLISGLLLIGVLGIKEAVQTLKRK